jgi:hypothetical protein
VRPLLYYATKWAALIGIVCSGLLTLTVAAANRLLPAEPFAALVVGYLIYGAGAGIATLLLLAPGLRAHDEAR